jgi:hypothetical protein
VAQHRIPVHPLSVQAPLKLRVDEKRTVQVGVAQ